MKRHALVPIIESNVLKSIYNIESIYGGSEPASQGKAGSYEDARRACFALLGLVLEAEQLDEPAQTREMKRLVKDSEAYLKKCQFLRSKHRDRVTLCPPVH